MVDVFGEKILANFRKDGGLMNISHFGNQLAGILGLI